MADIIQFYISFNCALIYGVLVESLWLAPLIGSEPIILGNFKRAFKFSLFQKRDKPPIVSEEMKEVFRRRSNCVWHYCSCKSIKWWPDETFSWQEQGVTCRHRKSGRDKRRFLERNFSKYSEEKQEKEKQNNNALQYVRQSDLHQTSNGWPVQGLSSAKKANSSDSRFSSQYNQTTWSIEQGISIF